MPDDNLNSAPAPDSTPAPAPSPAPSDAGSAPSAPGLSAEDVSRFKGKGLSDEDLGVGTKPAEAKKPDAPAAKPGAAADDDTDDDDDATTPPREPGKEQKRVSFHKFQRSEERRKAAEKKAAEAHDFNTRLSERLTLINEALAPTAAEKKTAEEEDPEPDVETDIFGHNAWLKRQLIKQNGRLDAISKERQTEQQERQNERMQGDLVTYYRADAQKFAQSNADFADAYVHLVNTRLAELEAYGMDERQRDATIKAEERDLVLKAAIERQKNPDAPGPAERIYRLARLRGWNPTAAPATRANGNGAAAAAVPGSLADGSAAPAAASSVTKEIEAIRKGQEHSMSLSSGGGAPLDQLTPAKLADMPQDEFEAFLSKLPKSRQKELLGG